MNTSMQHAHWAEWHRLRGIQQTLGRIGAVFLLCAALSMVDGVQSLMRHGADVVELIPGQAESLSGGCPFKNPIASDLKATLPDKAPLRFELEGFFVGYVLGSGMWRGHIIADDTAQPGEWLLRVGFKGTGGKGMAYKVIVYADEQERQNAAPSYVRRFLGLNSFWLAGVLGVISLALGFVTFRFGRNALLLLRSMGYSEIDHLGLGKDGEQHCFCLDFAGHRALQVGELLDVFDQQGQPRGQVQVVTVEKRCVELRRVGEAPETGLLVRLVTPKGGMYVSQS